MKLLFLFSVFICLNCYKIDTTFKTGKKKTKKEPGVITKKGVKVVSGNITKFKNYNYTKSKSDWMPIITGRIDD